MRKIILFVALFIFVLSIFSCNKIPKHAKYIPKNALAVMTVDMNKMSKKLIWNVLTGSEIFDDMQKDIKNEESKKAMKDFSNIGIDPTETIYLFYNGNMKNENHPCLLAAMKDASKFETFINKNYPEIKLEENKDFKTCIVEKKYIIAWNKDAAIATLINSNEFNFETEETDSNAVANLIDGTNEKTYLAELFTQKSNNAITDISNFKKLQNEGHDFAVWVNYEELYNQSAAFGGESMKAFLKPEYMKDAALAMGFNFEKGSLDMEMDYYFSEKLASIYKKYATDNVNADLVNNIPSNNIAFIGAYNIKPKMIQAFLEEFKLDGMANLGLAAVGMSMETIMSAFKGDMVYAMSDLKMKPKDSTKNDFSFSNDTPDFNVTYAMSIDDVTSFEKILNKGVKENFLTKNGNSYSLPNSQEGVLIYDKNKMVFSNHNKIAEQYMTAKGNAKENIPAEVWKHIANNPISFYADLKKIMEVVPNDEKDEANKQLMSELKTMFTYAQLYGGKMKGNANHLEGNLYFANKDENAMIQLIKLGIKAKKVQDAKDKNVEEPIVDSLAI